MQKAVPAAEAVWALCRVAPVEIPQADLPPAVLLTEQVPAEILRADLPIWAAV